MKGGRADQRTAGTKPWRCKTAKFFSWTLSGVQGGGVEVLVRDDAENMLRGQIIRSIYAKRKFKLYLVIKGEIPKN